MPTSTGRRFLGEQISAKYDLMYYIEAVDVHDNGRIFPDLEKETPYVVVHLRRTMNAE